MAYYTNSENVKQIKTVSTLDELKDHIEALGWNVTEYEKNEWNIAQYSPAGEDFSFSITHNDSIKDAILEIFCYAYNFDVDEHIEMWVEARNNGVSGVPNARTLVHDAEDIQEMLDALSESFQVLSIAE